MKPLQYHHTKMQPYRMCDPSGCIFLRRYRRYVSKPVNVVYHLQDEMLTAKQGSRLPTTKQLGRLVMGARRLLGGKNRLTVLSGKHILIAGNLHERSHMQSDHHKDLRAAAIGSLGGIKRKERLNAEQRSAIARLGARARHHPLEFQAEQEKAMRQAYLFQQALQVLQDGKQLPLV